MAENTGKISFDELSEELLQFLSEGGKIKWIDDSYKMRDTNGEFTIVFGTERQEFPLVDLLKAYANDSRKLKELQTAYENFKDENAKREIELLKREIEILKEQLAKAIQGGGNITPPQPEGENYSTNRSDYVVTYENDFIKISIGASELKIPISMLVTEERAQQTIRKGEQTKQSLIACINSLKSTDTINQYLKTKIN